MGIIDRVRNAVIYVDNRPFAWFTAGSEDNALTADMPRQPPARGITEVGDLVLLTEAIEADGEEIAVISLDRKSTRLNSSHVAISSAVLCLKKNTNKLHLYS